jgi:hypothetical protein
MVLHARRGFGADDLVLRGLQGGGSAVSADYSARPLAIDLFCGLGGWTDGLLAEGYHVIGFDIERHEYGEDRYPGKLVIQDVCTVHGSQFKNATLIVASPPCQKYIHMGMPWKLAKAKAKAIRDDTTGEKLAELNKLFNECFRIQREASFAAGRHIPLVVENVRGAQPWVGRARWNFGSFYLWGDVPALMPPSFNAFKVPSFRFDGSGQSFQSASVRRIEISNGARKSPTRKQASAMIAKIPLPLSRHIAATFRPRLAVAA